MAQLLRALHFLIKRLYSFLFWSHSTQLLHFVCPSFVQVSFLWMGSVELLARQTEQVSGLQLVVFQRESGLSSVLWVCYADAPRQSHDDL